MNQEKNSIRDRLWLWCHSPGSHTRSPKQHGLVGRSTITPIEAAGLLGISNVLMVRYEKEPLGPFLAQAPTLASLKRVVWSLEGGGGEIDDVLELRSTLPNLFGVILDDYFYHLCSAGTVQEDGPYSLEALKKLRCRLDTCQPPLQSWIVLYAHELAQARQFLPYLELCDVITFWTWQAAEVPQLEDRFVEFCQVVGDKRKMLGIYMWDYGAKQPMPLATLERQSALALEWLAAGQIEGIIFLASCICDLGLESVEWVRQWIANH
ncbi:MAG: hypothetical protein KatS3mg105_4190 [Gemmatales bacterium]|nr:MAG: hypothetical protein KatS3mg105_4190 [Gemmatales bacterium]